MRVGNANRARHHAEPEEQANLFQRAQMRRCSDVSQHPKQRDKLQRRPDNRHGAIPEQVVL